MNREIKLKIEQHLQNKTVGYVLKNSLKLSKNIITKLKQNNTILLNGINVHTNRIVNAGDELLLIIYDKKSESIISEEIPINVIYEDNDILAINKPFNMPTHPSKEHVSKTLANGVVYYLKNSVFRVITRLDKDTSGVVLVAKNHFSAHKLNQAMRNGEMQKEYVAWVVGKPDAEEGIVNAPIGKDRGIRRMVTALGKEAITHYKVEKTEGNFSFVRLNPITGRTHQLRVHMSHIGTPIYGDWLYGEMKVGERTRLHCRKIEFIHPVTGENIIIEAPLPEDMKKGAEI